MIKYRLFILALSCAVAPLQLFSQTGSPTEPVRYVGGEICNPRLHEGGFRYVIGTENIQVMRANRAEGAVADPNVADSVNTIGWTYNHAPNLTYWNGKFYLEYLANPKDEQQPPGHTLLVTSTDGRNWGKPVVVFPMYKAPKGVTFPKPYYGYIMHQRMGFYTAPNGRLLVVGFYGHSYNPFKEGGIGRVVREMKADGRSISCAIRRTPAGTSRTQAIPSSSVLRTRGSRRHAGHCWPTSSRPFNGLTRTAAWTASTP